MGVYKSISSFFSQQPAVRDINFYIRELENYYNYRQNLILHTNPRLPANKSYYRLSVWGRLNKFSGKAKCEATSQLLAAARDEFKYHVNSEVQFTDLQLLALRNGNLGAIVSAMEKDHLLPKCFIEQEKWLQSKLNSVSPKKHY